MNERILICWTGIGEDCLEEKQQWVNHNFKTIEHSKGSHQVEYLAFSYQDKTLKLPETIQVIYRPGIVFQFMYEELKPKKLLSKYDYILLMLDDIILHNDFSLQEYIDIYKRNRLDILQCAIYDQTNHPWMLYHPEHSIGRLTNMAEYFSYLMSVSAYQYYYDTFLTPQTFWGWGIDINLWNVGRMRVGILDKWPLFHRIMGRSYSKTDKDPFLELSRWPAACYEYFGQLV